jgi:hypothetical protein
VVGCCCLRACSRPLSSRSVFCSSRCSGSGSALPVPVPLFGVPSPCCHCAVSLTEQRARNGGEQRGMNDMAQRDCVTIAMCNW